MKKIISLLFLLCFAVSFAQAQTSEVLTNATIVKMVKAKLSDDIIIDEINNARVNFDVSPDGIKSLTAQNVSEPVIETMKKAVAAQESITKPAAAAVPAVAVATTAVAANQATAADQPATTAAADTLEKEATKDTNTRQVENPAMLATGVAATTAAVAATTLPNTETNKTEAPIVAPAVQVKDEKSLVASEPVKTKEALPPGKIVIETSKNGLNTQVMIKKTAFEIHAVSYVNPTKALISFYNDEFTKLAQFITDWDKKLQASLSREQQSIDAMNQLEKTLTEKKNADAKPFSKEITDQKNTLLTSREKHKVIKSEMAAEGKALVENLQKLSKETESSVADKYKEVSKNIKSSNPDPSVALKSQPIAISEQKFNQRVTSYFAPVTMMLVCFQNENTAMQETISAWNSKVLKSFQQDSLLRLQLDPLQSELSKYQATSKQDQKLKKKEITALKKQCENLEKERKTLSKQMETDSQKLAETMDKMSTEVQAVVKERYEDIIQEIEHYYKDKFNE